MTRKVLSFPGQPEYVPPKPLQGGGGDGTFDGMEARVAKLEAQIENIGANIADMKVDLRDIKKDAKTDFRTLFAALIAVALGLASLIAKGFHWL